MARKTAILWLLVALASAPAQAAEKPALRDAIVLGVPRPASVSIRELVVEIPVTVKPVGIGGRVHHVRFSEMSLNGIPFAVDPYDASFDLPDESAIALEEPLRLRLEFASVAPGLLAEALAPSEKLELRGKVGVDATLKKWLFSTRRDVELPLEVTSPNPLAEYRPLQTILEQLERLEHRSWKLHF
jgi:hypothetical protein